MYAFELLIRGWSLIGNAHDVVIEIGVLPSGFIPAKVGVHPALLHFLPLGFEAEAFPSPYHTGIEIERFVAIEAVTCTCVTHGLVMTDGIDQTPCAPHDGDTAITH